MGNGWSNEIPNPLVVGGGGASGEIIVEDSSDRVIARINQFGLELYDTAGNLIVTLAPTNETDDQGNVIFQGVASYDPVSTKTFVQLVTGEVAFNFTDQANGNGGGIQLVNPHASASVSPRMNIQGPVTNVVSDTGQIIISGLSADGTGPSAILFKNVSNNELPLLLNGTMVYASAAGAPETWHSVSFAANWSNNGGAFRNVKYRRTPDGRVAFVGMAKFTGTTTAPTTVFTLPAGYRPDASVNLVVGQQGNPVVAYALDIDTAGVVTATQFTGTINPGPLSFEGLSFYLSGA